MASRTKGANRYQLDDGNGNRQYVPTKAAGRRMINNMVQRGAISRQQGAQMRKSSGVGSGK